MANVKKYTLQSVGHMFDHYSRRPDDGVERRNEGIVPGRTYLNYDLAADLHPDLTQKKFLDKRLSEIRHLDLRQRDNIKVMCDWAVTMPVNVPRVRDREFFRIVYDFLREKYGEKNVISAWVHMDERSPHIHFAFIPVVTDPDGTERLCAKEVINRNDLKRFHPALQKYCEEKMHIRVDILNGATEGGNLTITELKTKEALKELAAVQAQKICIDEARPIIDNVLELMNRVSEMYSKLNTALNTKKWFGDSDKARMKEVSCQLDELISVVKSAGSTAKYIVGKLDTLQEDVSKAVGMTIEDMRKMQEHSVRRIKREEERLREYEEALKKKEEDIETRIREGVWNEMLRLRTVTGQKQALIDQIDCEIDEKTELLNSLNEEIHRGMALLEQFSPETQDSHMEYNEYINR